MNNNQPYIPIVPNSSAQESQTPQVPTAFGVQAFNSDGNPPVIKPTLNLAPVFAQSVNVGEVGAGVMNEMTSKSDLLVIKNIVPGSFFKGIVYCIRTAISANIYETQKMDLSLTLIDGEGVQFSAKYWASEKNEKYTDTVLYVEGTTVQHDKNHDDIPAYEGSQSTETLNIRDAVRFRLTRITAYGVAVSKSLFIKEIPYIDTEWTNVEQIVNKIANPVYSELVRNILYKEQVAVRFRLSPYKPTLGTALGMKMTLISMADIIISTLNNRFNHVNYDFAITLLLLHMANMQLLQDEEMQTASVSFQLLSLITSYVPTSVAGVSNMSTLVSGLIQLQEPKVNGSYMVNFLRTCINTIEKSMI